ncbi:MAG: sigma-70 family RNA polymerase sigma factor [Akkermansiaceae bacterium]|jgi:RNA polymerase sigma-70 factor (ECF subfamily)|nr:sigma-70 family RNA polymerase sigma factor [Akkermansiaceae bacterium]
MPGHSEKVSPDDRDQEFVRLLTTHQGPVLAYIRSLMPGFTGASDILQKTNITLWTKKDDFEIGTNFKAWAFSIARNHVMDQRKKLKRNGWLVFSEDLAELFAAEAEEEEDTFDHDAAYRALEVCLSKLRPHDRELVQKRYCESVTLDEYARQIDRSAGTLKARLFKIRAGLRRCLDQQLDHAHP